MTQAAVLDSPPAGRPAPRRDESPWIVSPRFDLILFVAVTLLTFIPWVVSDVLHYPGAYVLIGVAIANGPHLISTWTRVYLVRRERFRRPIQYWLLPGAAAAFAVFNELRGGEGPVWVRTVIFYWASWHFVSQSWGILRIYQRKHGVVGTVDAKLEKALIYLPAVFCVLRRLYTGPWELFDVRVFYIRPYAEWVNGFGAAVAVVAVVYAIRWLRSWTSRPRAHNVRPIYLAFNFLGFAMPFMVIRDGTSAFAAAALWHAVQYIAIVWLFNRRRYAAGVDSGAPVISWMSQRGRAPAYVAVIAACAACVYTLAFFVSRAVAIPFASLAMTVWTGLTLAHYYVDGVIWKTRRYDLKTLG